MKKIYLIVLCFLQVLQSEACTNIIVTKGASSNNSNMIAYTCDGEFLPHLKKSQAQDHLLGDSVNIYDYQGNILAKIPQVAHTYAVLGYHNMNEFQVAMGETTFGGREELIDTTGLLNYWNLMFITLQRSKTAREAIKVMTDLVEKYGYASSGESFSICDKNEAWLLEMIGSGSDDKGVVWVARKIPDGQICAHANKARIGEFPLNDPENCLYSKNVISFAIEKGYYDPNSGKAFEFNEAYDPSSPANLRYCETRVWSIFRRAAPSQTFSPDYHRGVKNSLRYPLYIKPDKKLSVANVMSLIRDHYEGTEFDMTVGLAAGPFGNPNRWRPLVWEINNTEASWERCISTYNTGFSIVTQSRNNYPDEIGGLVWYGVDDSYSTCFAPVYICTDSIPKPYNFGNINEFSMQSVWWVFNLVSNYANTKYSYIIKDIQKVQSQIEGDFFSKQDSIEQKALELYLKDKELARNFLSQYSKNQMNYVYESWKNLSTQIITKYNDGYIRNEHGRPTNAGYPIKWRNKVIGERKSYLLPIWNDKTKTKEPDNF